MPIDIKIFWNPKELRNKPNIKQRHTHRTYVWHYYDPSTRFKLTTSQRPPAGPPIGARARRRFSASVAPGWSMPLVKASLPRSTSSPVTGRPRSAPRLIAVFCQNCWIRIRSNSTIVETIVTTWPSNNYTLEVFLHYLNVG